MPLIILLVGETYLVMNNLYAVEVTSDGTTGEVRALVHLPYGEIKLKDEAASDLLAWLYDHRQVIEEDSE